MASNYAEYAYTPLEVGCFRVLELFAVEEATAVFSSSGPPIYGRITHARFDKAPGYDALSYVWGDPTATERILLRDDDGEIRELGIAANLTQALRNIRRQDSPIVMWIDAICINQGDLTERSSEVKQMHRIYSHAACVRAWIDVNLDRNDVAVRRLPLLSPDHVTRFERADTGMSPIVNVNPDEDSDDDGIGDRAAVWQSLQALCEHKYWGRVWIQQEIYNARALVIHCGSTVLSGEDFAEFLRQLNARSKTVPEKQAFSNPQSWAGLMNPIQSMERNHTLFYGKARNARAKWKRDKAVPKEAAKRDLFDALVFAKHWLEATDPRDYVYGTLSLVDDFVRGKLDIQVDYRLTMVQVYTEAVDALIRNYQSLRFLTMTDLETSRKDGDLLPSWAPDWSLVIHHIPLHEAGPLDYLDNKQVTSFLPSISPCRRFLSVTGTQIGKILHICNDVVIEPNWLSDTPVKALAAMFNQLEDIARRASAIQRSSGYEPGPVEWPSHTDQPDPELLAILKAITAFECWEESHYILAGVYEVIESMKDVIDALLDVDDRIEPMPTTALGATVISGSDWSSRRLTKNLLRMHGDIASEDGGDATLATVLQWVGAVPGAKNLLTQRVYCATSGRRLFVSEQGLMGLAPVGAMVGDELWFLPGCEVPIVLRPKGDQYVVVGEGHVNEYMFSGLGPVVGDAYATACTLVDESNFKRIGLV